jgi:precorrin-2 dehydrogenase/sirohydrochlorin ferrochelatase
MVKYPIYLDLTNTRAVVVGAGSVAARKVKTLLQAGAAVKVVTLAVEKDFDDICKGLDIEIVISDYQRSHLKEAFLVIAATDDPELNTRIYNDCQSLKILCNVVDVPHLCNFYVPSVIRRGDLQIAIGTNGKCPAYAAHLKRTLEKLITENHARFLDCLDEIRQKIITTGLSLDDRKALLVQLADDASFEVFVEKGPEIWKQQANQLLSEKLTQA